MKSSRTQRADEFVPLSERVLVLMGFRFVAAITIGVLQSTQLPNVDVAQQWLIVMVYLAVSALLSAPVLTARRGLTLRAFGLSLLLDGLYFQGERVLGTPVGLDVIIGAYLVAICLLVSFRTGLKMALWHSLIVFMLRQAAVLGSITGAPNELRNQSQLLSYLGAMWLTVIVTAQFAALNERELRRRRYDAEAFRLFAVRLAGAEYVWQVRELLVEFCRSELEVERAAWIELTADGYTLHLGSGLADGAAKQAPLGASQLLAPQLTALQAAGSALSGSALSGSALSGSALSGSALSGSQFSTPPPRAVYRLGAGDEWLASHFPGGRRMIAVPVPGGEDWIVLEQHGRGNRLERRVISNVAQAAAASSLALSRTSALGQLRAAAATDGLTGSANRRTFDDTVMRMRRNGDALPVSLILVDIDHFKDVNDLHGHQMGDAVLQSVAHLLERTARATDLVARYGGEEFVVVLMRTSTADALEVAERMRSLIQTETAPLSVTVSIGVARAAERVEDLTELIAGADAALYEAKNSGRNRVVVQGVGVRQ